MAVVNTLQPIPVMSSTLEAVSIHPQITCESLLKASVQDKQSLLEIHDLLNNLFSRNRNQHRRNHWFKSLQQFRKQLSLLIQEMDSVNGNGVGKGKMRAVEEKLSQRLQFWDKNCVHQWYLHFTQLVAVGPFAMLGLVLMACTARVCRITGITALYEEIASEDMKMVMQMLDEGDVEDELGNLLVGGEDEGEVIERWE